MTTWLDNSSAIEQNKHRMDDHHGSRRPSNIRIAPSSDETKVVSIKECDSDMICKISTVVGSDCSSDQVKSMTRKEEDQGMICDPNTTCQGDALDNKTEIDKAPSMEEMKCANQYDDADKKIDMSSEDQTRNTTTTPTNTTHMFGENRQGKADEDVSNDSTTTNGRLDDGCLQHAAEIYCSETTFDSADHECGDRNEVDTSPCETTHHGDLPAATSDECQLTLEDPNVHLTVEQRNEAKCMKSAETSDTGKTSQDKDLRKNETEIEKALSRKPEHVNGDDLASANGELVVSEDQGSGAVNDIATRTSVLLSVVDDNASTTTSCDGKQAECLFDESKAAEHLGRVHGCLRDATSHTVEVQPGGTAARNHDERSYDDEQPAASPTPDARQLHLKDRNIQSTDDYSAEVKCRKSEDTPDATTGQCDDVIRKEAEIDQCSFRKSQANDEDAVDLSIAGNGGAEQGAAANDTPNNTTRQIISISDDEDDASSITADEEVPSPVNERLGKCYKKSVGSVKATRDVAGRGQMLQEPGTSKGMRESASAPKEQSPSMPGAFHSGQAASRLPSRAKVGKHDADDGDLKPRARQSPLGRRRVQNYAVPPEQSSPRQRSQWVPAGEETAKSRWARLRESASDNNRIHHTPTSGSPSSNGHRLSSINNRESISRYSVNAADRDDPHYTEPGIDLDTDNQTHNNEQECIEIQEMSVQSNEGNTKSMETNDMPERSVAQLENEFPTLEAMLVDETCEDILPIQATSVDDELSKRKRCFLIALLVVLVTITLSTTLALVLQVKNNSADGESIKLRDYACNSPGLTEMKPGKYEGISVNYLSFATNISSPGFPLRADEFEACTGGKIIFSEAANVWEDPITDLGTKASRGAEIFDGYLMSYAHFPEASHLGLLEHLNERIRQSNELILWQDMLPKVRSMGEFRKDGTTFVDFLMYDGDFFVPIVRLDLLEEHSIPLPNTWDELVEVASYFNGTDLNDDGIPDYGFCHFPRRGAGYWDWWFAESVYGTWASVEQTEGTEKGFLFDEETFEPRIGTGFRFAAGIWKELWNNGANCENTNFVEGRCAIGLGPPGCWKQVFQKGVKRVDKSGSLLWQPTMASGEYAEPYRFKTFGSTHVVDRATGEMVPCTRKLCPKAELIPERGHHGDNDRARVLPVSPLQGQLINRVPFYWSGGLGTAIRKSADPIKKDLLWDFFAYTNSPKTSVYDLVNYPSWLDAWRYSQLNPGDNFLAANWSKSAFDEHFDMMHWALSSEANGAFNLRLPGAAAYTRDVVGNAMFAFIEGLIETEEDLVAEVVNGWDKVTSERGKLDQLQIYRASLNLEQLNS